MNSTRGFAKISFLLFSLLIIAGCEPAYYLYHSTADTRYELYEKKTNMKLIFSDSNILKDYSICAAADTTYGKTNITYYLLLAPLKQGQNFAENMDQVNLTMAATLQAAAAKELIHSLKNIAAEWDLNQSRQDGMFYEFYSAPYYNFNKTSDSTFIAYPSVRINFQKINNYVAGVLFFKNAISSQTFLIKEKYIVEDLLVNLEMGMEELRRMGFID